MNTPTLHATIEYRRCAFAHSASIMVFEYANLDIDPERMSVIIGDKMDEEVSEYLYDPNDGYMDTCVRDQVFDFVSEFYLGHPWPRYRDHMDAELFDTNLRQAIDDHTL